MKSSTVMLTLLLAAGLAIIGCASSSEQASDQQKTQVPQVVQRQPDQAPPAEKVDTPPPNVQSVPPPKNEAKPAPASSGAKWTGKFAVQVGAFKTPDKAEQIAQVAKERFGANVFTVYDRDKDLTKVLVGDFMTKDEARKYRDQITKQYPDYADAWVTEFPHE